MKHLKKFLSVLLVLALVLIPFSTVSASILPEHNPYLTGYTVIMHTNDSHGRAVPNSQSGLMGFTAVSALKKAYEAAGAKVILLDAGDTLHGLPYANLTKGESIVKLMNAIGYDAMTPGNHDFNYGTDVLMNLSATMQFKLLSSNIMKKDTKSNLLEDSLIIEKNGIKYGIFGLSTPETTYKTNPNNVANLEFGNPVDAAKKEVTKLEAAGAGVIIALAHLGIDEGSKFTSKLIAKEVDGIDLIVDGHSHSTFTEGQMVEDTLIVSTGDYIKNIGVVLIDPYLNMKAGLVNSAEFTGIDPVINDRVQKTTSDQEKLLSEVVGYTSVTLDGVREHVRGGETNLGDLTADAMRSITGADVAFTNGGGIRASIEIGDITKKDLVTVFPFGNYVVTKKVTGEALLKALEHGVSIYPELNGAFLQVSGITFSIDGSKAAGSRVVNAKVNGTTIAPDSEYLLATNDFLVVGGDGYTMLSEFKVVNEYGSIEDVLAEYIQKTGDITLRNQNRITLSDRLETDSQLPGADEDIEEVEEEEAIDKKETIDEEEIIDEDEAADEAKGAEDIPDTSEGMPVYVIILAGLTGLSVVMVVIYKKKIKNMSFN